ncbi:MAG: SpoIID/LytB domain-containing protein [Cyanobacteriota bacterium]|nr:SpoIID/LytB domain-containing protein [Cyanobacteriota bacterium]
MLWQRSRHLATALRRRLAPGVPLWIGGPLALVVFGTGFAVQTLGSFGLPGQGQDPLLDALLTQPTASDLPRLQAKRANQRTTTDPSHRGQLVLSEPEAGPALHLEIRVALLSAGSAPNLSATGPWQLRSRDGQLLQQGQAGEPVALALALQAGDAWFVTSRTAALQSNGRTYPGRFRLIPKDGGVQVINHLGLESYIASVVGSEMPSSWATQALMAQAVAARSYALAHMARPANRNWHLGDTTRWQAYKGLERVNRRTMEAAAQTAGIILSYQGAIVESLYASNRQISLEAHGHLGASMSQHGARELAEAGHRYNAILGRYYPGASLARLRSGAS